MKKLCFGPKKKKNSVGCWENSCSGVRESLRWTENKWLIMEVQLYNSHQEVFQDSIKHRDLGGDHWPHFAPIYSKVYWPGSELARQDNLRWPLSVRVLALVHWAMSLNMQEAGPLVFQVTTRSKEMRFTVAGAGAPSLRSLLPTVDITSHKIPKTWNTSSYNSHHTC